MEARVMRFRYRRILAAAVIASLFAPYQLAAATIVARPASPARSVQPSIHAPKAHDSGGSQDPSLSVPPTPNPILTPMTPLGVAIPVPVTTLDPSTLAQQTTSVTYAQYGPTQYQTPQPLALPGPSSGNNLNSQNRSTHRQSTAGHLRGPRTRGSKNRLSSFNVSTNTADPDGINHWWEYEEDGLGGIGKY